MLCFKGTVLLAKAYLDRSGNDSAQERECSLEQLMRRNCASEAQQNSYRSMQASLAILLLQGSQKEL